MTDNTGKLSAEEILAGLNEALDNFWNADAEKRMGKPAVAVTYWQKLSEGYLQEYDAQSAQPVKWPTDAEIETEALILFPEDEDSLSEELSELDQERFHERRAFVKGVQWLQSKQPKADEPETAMQRFCEIFWKVHNDGGGITKEAAETIAKIAYQEFIQEPEKPQQPKDTELEGDEEWCPYCGGTGEINVSGEETECSDCKGIGKIKPKAPSAEVSKKQVLNDFFKWYYGFFEKYAQWSDHIDKYISTLPPSPSEAVAYEVNFKRNNFWTVYFTIGLQRFHLGDLENKKRAEWYMEQLKTAHNNLYPAPSPAPVEEIEKIAGNAWDEALRIYTTTPVQIGGTAILRARAAYLASLSKTTQK